MPSALRVFALAVVAAHLAAIGLPCLAAAPAAAGVEHRASDEAAAGETHAGHCAEDDERPPVDATAPCPCGCGDATAPGGIGGRLGHAVLRDAPEPLAPARAPAPVVAAPRLPAAPADELDPVPI